MNNEAGTSISGSSALTSQFHVQQKQNIDSGITKNKKQTENENLQQNKLDPNCILQINKRLVRIEYPAEVKNVDKAIETLGGIEQIESSVAEHGRKLELHFHPKNKYNNACVADKDFKPGILIKVKKKSLTSDLNVNEELSYVVDGVSVINFGFNRLCDFQYLPLISNQPETKLSITECIYEKIVPQELPNSEWLESEQARNMEQFLLPVRFSHYDSSQVKLNVDNEKNEPKLKLKGISSSQSKINPKQQKSVCKIFGKTKQQNSIFVTFQDKEIPTGPLESALKLLKHRNLEERIGRVRQLFEERPIWTKAAIRYNTGLTDEHSKIILPVVAYYFPNGPWRISWVKFGYDPRKDPKARIYQTLDYRIRTALSANRKSATFLGPTHVKKMSLKHDMSAKPKNELDERYYVLRPLTVPPARQMYYQLCDLIIPQIQEKISRLPKFSGGYCDPKNGWLPENFIADCRKIVNDHVLEAIQKELLEDKKVLQAMTSKEKERKKESGSNLDYCNQMLSNIKKGIYKTVDLQPRYIDTQLNKDTELISLSSDEENELTVGEIIQSSIPERMEEGEEEEHSDVSESSDEAEIDMEAVQEINEMISQFNVKM